MWNVLWTYLTHSINSCSLLYFSPNNQRTFILVITELYWIYWTLISYGQLFFLMVWLGEKRLTKNMYNRNNNQTSPSLYFHPACALIDFIKWVPGLELKAFWVVFAALFLVTTVGDWFALSKTVKKVWMHGSCMRMFTVNIATAINMCKF